MKEFRPRLTSEMLEILCEAIDREADRLAKIYGEKRKLHRELAFKLMEVDELNFDKDPEYQKLGLEMERIRQKVLLLEEIDLQFRSLLRNKTKGRRVVMRPWLSRIWHTGMDV